MVEIWGQVGSPELGHFSQRIVGGRNQRRAEYRSFERVGIPLRILPPSGAFGRHAARGTFGGEQGNAHDEVIVDPGAVIVARAFGDYMVAASCTRRPVSRSRSPRAISVISWYPRHASASHISRSFAASTAISSPSLLPTPLAVSL